MVTRWLGDGKSEATAFAPEVAGHFEMTVVDAVKPLSANLPPQPNVHVVEVEVSAATLAAIKADLRYGNVAVLWEGDPANSPVVTTNQYNTLITFLAGKFSATETAVRALLGATANARTRVQIAKQIIAYLRTRPHA